MFNNKRPNYLFYNNICVELKTVYCNILRESTYKKNFKKKNNK